MKIETFKMRTNGRFAMRVKLGDEFFVLTRRTFKDRKACETARRELQRKAEHEYVTRFIAGDNLALIEGFLERARELGIAGTVGGFLRKCVEDYFTPTTRASFRAFADEGVASGGHPLRSMMNGCEP